MTVFFPSRSGKIVSPKWKSFKGLRLLWRDKIRLNNAIWRAWFIQCKRTAWLRNSTPFLHFQDCNSIFCKILQNEMSPKISALFRCGEEEEPSVRVHHATRWLRSRFASKAWGDAIIQSIMCLRESSCRYQQLVEFNRNSNMCFCMHCLDIFKMCS